MTARSRRPGGHARPRGKKPSRWPWPGVALAVLVGAGGWLFLHRHSGSGNPPPPPRDLHQAIEQLRAARAENPGDIRLLGALATALNNESYATRVVHGRVVPALATSLQRVRNAQEALRACNAVEALNPRSLAAPHYRGLLYAAWGLPEEASYQLSVAIGRGDTTAEAQQLDAALTDLQLGGAEAGMAHKR